jgi:pimeloyl-ACP methyl ester carboxylesterase
MGQLILRGMGVVVVLLAALVFAGLAYRAVQQHRRAKATQIDTQSGIDEGRFIKLGGLEQWVTIRGQNRSNPILLVVDGGPGYATSQDIPSILERDFTVVSWDQPGAGKTFGRAGGVIGPNVTMESIADDGIGVADYARQHLHRTKVAILGTSFGSIIGVEMIRRRPDLFYAYVGSGQVVNMRRAEALDYEGVLTEARAREDQPAIRELEKGGPPPYRSPSAFRTQRKWALAYEAGAPSGLAMATSVVFAPRYGLTDAFNWFWGFLASQDHFFGKAMEGPAMAADLPALGADFAVPIFVFQGTDDRITPFELVKAYVDTIRAPQKLLVAVPGAGHFVAVSHASELRDLMIERVRPLGVQAG